MPLHLICGPPNSGRAGLIRRGFEDALGRDPVLIVPTADDVDRFEREYCEAGRAMLGGTIGTFARLFGEVARATGVDQGRPLSHNQRIALVREAVRRVRPRVLAASARRPGFAPALEELLGELQAACVTPDSIRAQVSEAAESAYLEELTHLYVAYAAIRDELGRGDAHTLAGVATSALRANPEAWGSRPVLLYGFDDLTIEQRVLVETLAGTTEVTVALTYEDRSALAARATLLGELRELGPSERHLEPNPEHTESTALFHLERGFLEPGATRVPPDPGIAFLASPGVRAEVELIGDEIARLLRDGASADRLAVVLRNPDSEASLYAEVLGGYGIPVAVEGRVPFAVTATGGALLALARIALAEGSATDLVTFLRTPGRADRGRVDRLERDVRRRRLRTAEQAIDSLGWEPDEIARLQGARERGELPAEAARIALAIAERGDRRAAPRLGEAERLELRAAAEAAEALAELAELAAGDDPTAELFDALDAVRVSLWRGHAEGRVRVLSPYAVRARRFSHVFVASLQEGEFPRLGGGDPFLSDEQRVTVGLPARASVPDEERFLFYSCVSRPTERLYLSFRTSDEEGGSQERSALVDEVRALLEKAADGADGDPVEARITRSRHPREVVFEPVDAPSEGELARSLAVLGEPGAERACSALTLAAEIRERTLERLGRAFALAGVKPGPLRVRAVVDALEERSLFGASTLESYLECSYRWFVDHELDPQGLDPDSDALSQGSLVHDVLERLYREPPGGARRPRPQSLEAWKERGRELLSERAAAKGLAPRDAPSKAGFARMQALVFGLLEREASAEVPLEPNPELLEASFGAGENDDRPGLDLGGFGLHGKIDRVDVPVGGAPAAGLIYDYKTSSKVTAAAKLAEEGKLQLPLYMLALRELWDRVPLGAIYLPLGGTADHRGRGLLRGDEQDGLLAKLPAFGNEFLAIEDLEALLDAAVETASGAVTGMRDGEIDRNPIGGACPPYCEFQPICRRERAPEPPSDEDEEEEAG